jgi:hypothetical protein
VFYRETHALLDDLAEATFDGTQRAHGVPADVPLLIIDDLGMRKLPLIAAEELLEILMRRLGRWACAVHLATSYVLAGVKWSPHIIVRIDRIVATMILSRRVKTSFEPWPIRLFSNIVSSFVRQCLSRKAVA